MRYWGYYPQHIEHGFGFNIVGFIIEILFWVLIIAVFMTLFKHFGHMRSESTTRDGDESDHALEIVRERYAKGEISKKEFEELKKDLISTT
ncbi:hypothetical protein A2334_00565 [Candidatus Roizmanbacteria bacterium RIFOXYB2_FULL_38_10]|uniref:SHOCT domain-containing protein n=1 Tax=Candidatus Roizmanbacteria bacterium RIFOXYD1_FULL_38_12 TaxID=1802093 RepID=A0A1F7L1A3_9BACT|nr:MAG: hypothetical protein A3K47_03835 [Candidatus Roizmanbacteria bacterium RIFOXYA2_FULL_38_14]OGK63888.1 MAG: hypothetical protein A3K27_03835 [Candidatus Roizmanbacteria bacterium RIFOXYA1_FULL_37_12]OGK65734.1 MAG: hypothetical protein A3K38_03835 [Candidatus Roizmanbacteria bacterium RIFOXYB1_FULL_40_23]OGK68179.1 MAG: hypothetical protein A2334_00565 [Candidatus Roizmanbacteria bacterium RIFOXYB2_FULL_38_10]OGK70139.1 MAG: hypothetical protein A3K21_03840 [Candidatus Roizmanbacteria ba